MKVLPLVLLLIATLLAGCNLSSAPEQQLALTEIPTNTPPPSRTPAGVSGVPTTLPLTPLPTTIGGGQGIVPTSAALPPTGVPFPTLTPTPISIVILSPIPGNVVASNVQILGAAIHPQFLQYQVEYGPDPNPSNLWFAATSIVQTPVLNGLLGIWNTTTTPDGIYQLRLRVTLSDGTSLATVVNNIRVQNQQPTPIPSATPSIQRPIAAFTLDRSSGQTPLVVRFTNQSSGQISSYTWDFGDGGTSTEASPTYTFRRTGVFNVILTVAGPGGSSNVSRQVNVQSPAAPLAAFTQDRTSGPAPLTVRFTNQSSGQITGYTWDFGDGSTSTEQNPIHQFARIGTYNVILTVTGPGGTAFATVKVTAEDTSIPAPDAVFTAAPASGNAPLDVQFTSASTGQITSYSWDFGDGSTSTETNPRHRFDRAGTYTVRLTVVGPGGQDNAQQTISVTQQANAPVASFRATPLSGNVPLNVRFENTSSGSITSYSWDFGDGQTSAEQSPSHNYTVAGTYTVKLTVSGPGGTSEATGTITATQPVTAPTAAFAADPTTGEAPLTVVFRNQSTGQGLSNAWDFGDGQTSTETSPTHIFNAVGRYEVKLTVTNSAGSSTATAVIQVSDRPVAPVASFTANPPSGDAPLNVQFDSSASSGMITSYAWDFGDGGTSADANPSHQYTTPNTYTVTLTVSGPAGSNSTTGTVTVNAAAVAPVASFTANPPSGAAPLNVQFDSSASSGTITSYAWDFGDGGTSADANPSHQYTTPNTYTVTLTVSGPAGSNSTTGTVTVNAAAFTSPISEPVAFVTDRDGNNEIYLLDTDGTLTNLTNNGANDFDPAWSSDGSQITFVSNRDGNNEIYVMNADGSGVQRVTDNPADDVLPVWSSDNRQIAFVSNRDGNNEIYVMNADGTDPVNVTNNPTNDTMPAPAPNGTQIAFVTDRDGNNEIYVLNADGSSINISNDVNNDFAPAWTSDSGRVAFVSNRDGNNEIYGMNADGSDVRRLTDNGADDLSPNFTSDDSQLAFITNRDGNNEVYQMNVDGSNPLNVTNNPASESSPRWRR
ncbi:MAG: PKD domain-containing protein [Anaerolineae bacterium]|nr:PKD domain-containing protein [Anaerolineae bacterium]